MNRYRFFTAINWVVALLLTFSACTNDEPMDPNALPEGKYPLEIASVTMSVESSSEPWSANAPQTRVTESENGNSSVWEWNGTERIGVQLYGDVATYTLNNNQTLTPDKTLYWENKEQTTVMAWYPAYEGESGTVSLADQSGKLAYVLKGNGTGNYNNPVGLGFDHALAKVRVVLDGTQAAQAETVEVRGYTTCTHTAGVVSTEGAEQGWLKMKRITYADGTECWEANVVPGNITLDNFVRINDQTAKIKDGFPTKLEAAKMYTIDLTVGNPLTEITADNCGSIGGDGNYRVKGSFGQTITVIGGSPTIYLENANINITSDNHAINITGGNPTIYILGNNNISVNENNYGAGIYVAEGNSVTITGTSVDDVLVVTGGSGCCGIGGYLSKDTWESHPCGNITIENITVRATSNIPQVTGGYAAAIGATGNKTVGSIKISNAVVYAHGGGYDDYVGAGIGGGVSSLFGFGQTEFDISIADSEIHVSRGCPYASYIGAGGMRIEQTNYKIIPSAKITNSIIYDESEMEITQ